MHSYGPFCCICLLGPVRPLVFHLSDLLVQRTRTGRLLVGMDLALQVVRSLICTRTVSENAAMDMDPNHVPWTFPAPVTAHPKWVPSLGTRLQYIEVYSNQ
jgi:hypothetical protein